MRALLACAMVGIALVGCRERSSDDAVRAPRLVPATTRDTIVSVRDIVNSQALLGRVVRVTGRCPSVSRGLDRPPRMRDAWQLEADGVVVFVVGRLPEACSGRASSSLLTITAVVARDTLPPLGDLPASTRRYLVLIGVNGPSLGADSDWDRLPLPVDGGSKTLQR